VGIAARQRRQALAAVPPGIDPVAVGGHLRALPGVAALHDLHIWPMSTTETALTAHVVTPAGYPGDAFLHDLAHRLEHDFRIGHVTIQVETRPEADCRLESEAIV